MHRNSHHHAGKWLAPLMGVLALGVFPGAAVAAPPTNTTPPAITVPSGGASNEVTNPSEGRILASNPGTWAPTQTQFSYQWTHDCSAPGVSPVNLGVSIPGARGANYQVANGDITHTLCLTVTAGGTTALSAPTGVVSAGTPIDRAAPTMVGVTQDGQTLTANPGKWDGTQPISYAYQWRRCDANGKNCGASVTGAPNAANVNYVLGDSDVGHTISVVVTASNSAPANPPLDPNPVALGSFATATVVTPANTAAPTISGTPQQGDTLTESHGLWAPSSSTLAVQWESCDASGLNCAAIPGATAQKYTLTPADVGHTVVAQETASSNGAASGPAASSATGVVQAAPSTSGGSGGNPGGASGGNPGGSSGGSLGGGSGGNQGSVKPVPTPVSTPGVVRLTVQLRGLVANTLAVHGGAAQIRALLKRGGYAFTFSAPFAGRLAVSWYRVQHHRRMLVATVSVRLRKSGRAKIELKLTRAGRNLLKAEHRLTLAAQAGFTPVGQRTTSASKTITLIR